MTDDIFQKSGHLLEYGYTTATVPMLMSDLYGPTKYAMENSQGRAMENFPLQLPRAGSADPLLALTPARGVIEVKGTGEDVARVAESAQVRKYLERYGLALVIKYPDC